MSAHWLLGLRLEVDGFAVLRHCCCRVVRIEKKTAYLLAIAKLIVVGWRMRENDRMMADGERFQEVVVKLKST